MKGILKTTLAFYIYYLLRWKHLCLHYHPYLEGHFLLLTLLVNTNLMKDAYIIELKVTNVKFMKI